MAETPEEQSLAPHPIMARQAGDLRDEGDAVHALLETLDEADWQRETPFKSWTVCDVVAHLHAADRLALASLRSREAFAAEASAFGKGLSATRGDQTAYARQALGADRPAELHALWRKTFAEMCDRFADADPRLRVAWFGPDMSARMSASARQMETWAHAQDVYDLLRLPREHHDRLRNVVAIGVRTYGWSFRNRGLEPPGPPPRVRVTAPSGALWTYHDENERDLVEGTAVDFCHVVTQGRNVADTALRVRGPNAAAWMAIAQCFAGPPVDPPAKGERSWSSAAPPPAPQEGS